MARTRIKVKATKENDPYYKWAKMMSDIEDITYQRAYRLMCKYANYKAARQALNLERMLDNKTI